MTSLLFALAILLIAVVYGAVALAIVMAAAWLYDRLILWPLWHRKQRRFIDRMCNLGASLRKLPTENCQPTTGAKRP
jgi:hypothetical protein